MGETPDQIERHIYEKRSELGENIHELQEKVKTAVDWRAQFEQRPLVMIGLAFGGGLLLSVLFSGGRNSRRPSRDWSQRFEYAGKTEPADEKISRTWENIRGAALAVAGTRLGTLLEGVLPGFQEQFKAKQRDQSSSTSRRNGPETGVRRTAGGETDYMPHN